MWWDQEEEWEYVHLLGERGLGGGGEGEGEWVRFGVRASGEGKENENDSGNENEALMIDDLAVGDERRGSVDSELDSRYVVKPLEDEEMGMVVVPDDNTNNSRTLLSIPSRPAKHLRRAPEFMRDIDVNLNLNIAIPASPSPSPTRSRSSTHRSRSPIVGSFSHSHSHLHSRSHSHRPKGKARRRPAPLNLSTTLGASADTLISSVIPGSGSVSCERVRRDFIEDSFQPSVPLPLPSSPIRSPGRRLGMGTSMGGMHSASSDSLAAVANAKLSVSQTQTQAQSISVKAKSSRLGMRGLFKGF